MSGVAHRCGITLISGVGVRGGNSVMSNVGLSGGNITARVGEADVASCVAALSGRPSAVEMLRAGGVGDQRSRDAISWAASGQPSVAKIFWAGESAGEVAVGEVQVGGNIPFSPPPRHHSSTALKPTT